MRFLADMGVSVRVVRWLRNQGHDATHLRDEGLQRMPNGEIFAKAVAERRVILTFDLDFGEIAALSRGQKVSVILFRLHNARTPHVIDRLRTVLAESSDALALSEERSSRWRTHGIECAIFPLGRPKRAGVLAPPPRGYPEHLPRACGGIVEGLVPSLVPSVSKEFTLSSSKGPRPLAISWSRDGLFGPQVLFGFWTQRDSWPIEITDLDRGGA